ncbi:hypothetical protein ACJJTC_009467 [Scirpophaga incertulas]
MMAAVVASLSVIRRSRSCVYRSQQAFVGDCGGTLGQQVVDDGKTPGGMTLVPTLEDRSPFGVGCPLRRYFYSPVVKSVERESTPDIVELNTTRYEFCHSEVGSKYQVFRRVIPTSSEGALPEFCSATAEDLLNICQADFPELSIEASWSCRFEEAYPAKHEHVMTTPRKQSCRRKFTTQRRRRLNFDQQEFD